MSETQIEWFNCECGDNHHSIRLIYDGDEGDIFFEFRVNSYKSFWQRLRSAFKYLFNINNHDASYDTMIVRKDEAQRMIKLLEKCNG